MSVKLGDTDIAGTQVLYSTTGNNTDGAMTQAATTAQLSLKANDTDVVHLTGTETITGTKTFNSNVFIKNTEYAYNETPSSNSFTSLYIRDKNDLIMGACELVKLTNGNNFIQFNVVGQNGSWASSSLGLGVTSSGAAYTYCPASDANGSIVTTVNKSKAANGYFQLGNGMIVNWGNVTMKNDTTTTFTFAKAFSSATSYAVAQGYWSPASGRQDPLTMTAKTNTGFTIRNSAGGGTNNCLWVAIGY